jgi:hypothetical protein
MDPFTLALIGGSAASAIGGLMGNRASNAASGAQAAAALQSAQIQAQQAEAARQQQERFFNTAKAGYDPYSQFGQEATNRYATLMGLRPGKGSGSLMEMPTRAQIELDPGYEFRFSQGMRGVNASAAAKAGLQSGAALKAAERFGAGEASQEYGNAYKRFMDNRLNQIAMLQGGVNTGLTAAQGVGNLATNTGTNIANTMIGAGQAMGQGLENAAAARASGYMGGASALQGALNTPVNAMMAYGMADKFAPARTSTYAPQQVGYLGGAPSYGAGYSPGFMGAPTFGAPKV